MKLPVIKLHYLIIYAVLGALMPYLPIYAQQLGLDKVQIGWVMGVFGLAVIVMPPVYTLLADRWFSNRSLIGFCYIIASVAVLIIYFSKGFVGLLIGHLLFSLGFTALIPLMDGLAFHVLKTPLEEGTPTVSYQSIRVWGSVGWMVPGVCFTLLYWVPTGHLDISHFAIGFTALLAVVGVIASARLPADKTAGDSTDSKKTLPTIAAFQILIKRDTLCFFAGLFLVFICTAIYFTVYSLFMDALEIPRELFGMISNIGVVVEIGCFALVGWFLKRFGLRKVVIAGVVITSIRMGLMAMFPTAAMAIGTQLLHGPMVMALYLIPPMYLNQLAKPQYRNSVQGLYSMICFGVARVGGSAVSGYVAEQGGGGLDGIVHTFYLAAALAALAAVWLWLTFKPPNEMNIHQ